MPSNIYILLFRGVGGATQLPTKPLREALAAPGEGIEVIGDVAYLHTPGGFSQSKPGARFDKGLDAPDTARNWNTVLKLLDLAEAAAGA